ncbi:hypothetical protein K438DRAFT_1969980 [Mycena galopus ATCC 62051]|nr:hypothetical protein K438DRAFT_1969980 [Mycena galopus ATCC 62051]
MVRKKKGGVRGRKSDFTGEKMEWLDSFREQLEEAGDDPGPVYTEATNKFILRYGYNLPFKDNVEGDPEDDLPKLGNYFRNRWRAKKLHAGMIKGILGTMQTMTGPQARPRRRPALGLYSKLHYTTRVKPEFDAIWAEASKTLPLKERVAMSQDYTRTCWGKESAEFKDTLEKEAAELHRAELEKWKAARTIPEGSAEEYHEAMESLSEVGIPMADALAERLGSHVVILVVGPVGSEKGEVCLRTVFSDTSQLQTSRTWAAIDHAGFTAMEASITRYGRAAFSRSECKERAWPPLDDAGLPALDRMMRIDPDVPPPVADVATTMLTPAPSSTPVPAPAPNSMHMPVPNSTLPAPAAKSSTLAPDAASSMPMPDAASSTLMPDAASSTLMPDAASTTLMPDTTSSTPSAPAATENLATNQWSESLLMAHTYLSKKNWGPRWTALLDGLEFHDWMKEHRIFKDYTITAEFGAELFEWWRDLGPQNRWREVGEAERHHWEASRVRTDFWSIDWGKLGKRGRNGVVLPILGLAWWGQSICNAAVGEGLGAGEAALEANLLWQLMVEDVGWFLKEVLPQPQMAKADAERERLLLAAETSEERVEEGGKSKKGTKKTVAKKTVAPKTVAPKPLVTGTKRKHTREEDLPIAKKIAPRPVRPMPKPLTRGRALQERDENQATEGTKTSESGEIISPAAAVTAMHTGSGETSIPQTAITANSGISVLSTETPRPLPENPGALLPSSPLVAPPPLRNTNLPPPVILTHLEPSVMRAVHMDVDSDSGSGSGINVDVALSPNQRRNTTPRPLPENPVAPLPDSPLVAPLPLMNTTSFGSFSNLPPPVILTHLEPSVMRAVHMDVDSDSGSGSGIDVDVELSSNQRVTTETPVADDGDPFADGLGFNAEELAEMALDPEGDEKEDEEEEG